MSATGGATGDDRTSLRIVVEDGRAVSVVITQRGDLWFVDASAMLIVSGLPGFQEVGPFGSLAHARGYVLNRTEWEVGPIVEVRRFT